MMSRWGSRLAVTPKDGVPLYVHPQFATIILVVRDNPAQLAPSRLDGRKILICRDLLIESYVAVFERWGWWVVGGV